MARSRYEPYWLFGFEEVCTGCGHTHSHAVELRCVECDGPFCPICVIYVLSDPHCSECLESERED